MALYDIACGPERKRMLAMTLVMEASVAFLGSMRLHIKEGRGQLETREIKLSAVVASPTSANMCEEETQSRRSS